MIDFRFHGFYSRFLRDADGNPVDAAEGFNLEGEIAITRVALHRILTMLVAGTTLGDAPPALASAHPLDTRRPAVL